jgi:hypothetical protein
MKPALKTINIAIIIAVIMQKNNIQHIYIGVNTIFAENGVNMIESITYVKPYEDKK